MRLQIGHRSTAESASLMARSSWEFSLLNSLLMFGSATLVGGRAPRMPNDLPDVVSSTNRGLVNDAFLYFSAALFLLAVCVVSFVSASILDVGLLCHSVLLPSQPIPRRPHIHQSTHREARRDATFEHRTARGGSDTTPLGGPVTSASVPPRVRIVRAPRNDAAPLSPCVLRVGHYPSLVPSTQKALKSQRRRLRRGSFFHTHPATKCP